MIHFVVALPSEARPLIDRYRLKPVNHAEPFRIYEGGDKRLITSGTGKTQAASAAAFLYAFSSGARNQVWLNVGIGGHGKRNIGEGVLAHKITDRASGASWYPPIVFEPPCPTESLLTVDRPETDYHESWVYEMEAAGFYGTASRFSTAELVQCYKVISDNQNSSSRKISAPFVEKLIGGRLAEIDAILKETSDLASELALLDAPAPEFQEFLMSWHITVSEQYRLKRFLRRLGSPTQGQRLGFARGHRRVVLMLKIALPAHLILLEADSPAFLRRGRQ